MTTCPWEAHVYAVYAQHVHAVHAQHWQGLCQCQPVPFTGARHTLSFLGSLTPVHAQQMCQAHFAAWLALTWPGFARLGLAWLGLAWIASMDKDEGVHPAEKGNGTAGCKEAGRGLPCPTYQQMSLCGNKSCLWRGGPAGARARTHMCWDPRALLGSPKCCTGKLLGGVPTTCGAAATEQHKGVLALVHSSKQVSS